MKPKVIVFTTAYHPFIGCAEISIRETVRRLKDRFDFYIITHRINSFVPREEYVDGIPVYRLGFGTTLDRLFLFPFLAAWEGLRFVKSQKSKVKSQVLLWGVMITYASIGAFFVKLVCPRIPFVLTIQEGDSEAHMTWGKLGQAGLWWWLLLRRADYITAISSYLKEYARRRGYRGVAEVVPNGVDTEKFKVKSEKHAPYRTVGFGAGLKVTDKKQKIIITTSRLVYKNGIDTLILAMSEVRKKIPDVQCWIIGDGPERKKLELQTTNYKLQTNVKFFGEVPHEKIPEYLHQADIFVRPSRSEGMGISFVEALSAGLPIIGTKIGGITDIIEDGKTGLFARVDDPRDLADKIIRLFSDKTLVQRIVVEGQRMVRDRFSWDTIALAYQKVFDAALKNENVENRAFNILIATPLYPPQIGGPALYAKNLGERFVESGHRVRTLVFANFLRLPSGIRHLAYLCALCRSAFRVDVIFALDQFTEGAAALASMVLRKPVVVRVEGDFLWEEFVERARQDVTLAQFYKEPQPLSFKERIVRALSGWALRRATLLVFSSEWRRKMIVGAYGIPEEKTAVIRNAFPYHSLQTTNCKLQSRKVIFWAGRMLYLKNLYRLIGVFAKVNDGTYELHLVGDGPERLRLDDHVKNQKIDNVVFLPPMSHEELLEKFLASAFFVLPSLSDVGPNIIADAVSTQTPFIMTRESGYGEYIGETGLLVDPVDEEELAVKIKMLMDETAYMEYKNRLKSFAFRHEWRETSDEWILLFHRVCPVRSLGHKNSKNFYA